MDKRYQSGETDVGLGISHQGDAMARHYLYEAANVLWQLVLEGGQSTLSENKHCEMRHGKSVQNR